MTDTTNSSPETLSLAAQEVDNAIADIEAQIEFADLASGFNAYRKAVAAAALRAAADHMRHEFPLSPEYTEWDSGHDAGIQRAQNKILAIAAELEGQ